MRLFWLLALLLAWVSGMAQQGDYFMVHYTPPFLDQNYQIFDMDQDSQGIMYYAHHDGVLLFDGNNWSNQQAPGSIFALDITEDNLIYTGGAMGIHILGRDSHYDWQFTSLTNSNLLHDIVDIYAHGDDLFAISTTEVYRLHLATGQISRLDQLHEENWISLHRLEDRIYAVAASGRTYEAKDDRMVPVVNGFGSYPIRFICENPSGGTFLLVTEDNELLLYDGAFRKLLADAVDRRDREYLNENVIIEGKWLSDSLLVVSTLKGGVVFISNNSYARRDVQRIVNYQASLPDNQVFNMYVDNESAVWINHDRGLTRIDPHSPLQRFDKYPGLTGEIKSAIRFQDELYVGTTEGLYVLDEIAVYENIRTVANQWVSVNPSTSKGFIKRLFGKKTEPTRQKQEVVNTRRELHSIQYQFRPIENVAAKVLKFQVVGDELYAAGLGGIYRLTGESSQRIFTEPVQYFNYAPKRNMIYAITVNGQFHQILRKANQWETVKVHDFNEDIHDLVIKDGHEFFVGVHGLFIREPGSDDFISIPFQNPYYAPTYGYVENDTLKLINNSMAAYLDETEGKIFYDSTTAAPGKVISGANGTLWANIDGVWEQPGSKEKDVFRHLQILKGIEFLANDDQTGGKWVITSNGIEDDALFLLKPQEQYGWQTPYDMHVAEIYSNVQAFSPHEELVFGPEHNSITFRFEQPEFSDLVDTEYMYQLSGERERLSGWSTDNNELQLTYLPPGKYNLRVKSRNALGQVDELRDISFRVTSPYWKQTWFYALEFAIIALMLLISLRMKATRYLWISRLLALLTLITIIELIQNVAESKFETETSPVLGFIIQVILAFMILPIEEVIRKYIFKGTDAKIIDIIKLPQKQKEEVQLPD